MGPDPARGGARPADPAPTTLLALADQCVKCAYCLPHCPTFRRARNEGESPRGRVALIAGWLAGDLALTDALTGHLDSCLECQACEPACPSLVRFGELMDGARALRMQARPPLQRRLITAWLDLLAAPGALPVLATLAGLGRRLGLTALVARLAPGRWPRLAVLARVGGALRRPSGRLTAPPPSAGASANGALALFRGCVARAIEPALEQSALRVLTRLGFRVEVPDGQGCCGAMHRHNGLPGSADRLLAANRAAFGGATIVGSASACVAELRLHGGLDARELCRVLVDATWPEDLSLSPFDGLVAVHEPCSHRNQLRDIQAVYRLLERIPGARVVPLPGNDTCCAAAGTYLINEAASASEFGAAKVAALRALAPAVLVTTNTGCALQLRTLAEVAGLAVPVLHPVELIDRLLNDGPSG